jgi:iron complex outermembrane receptor protein
MKNLFLFSLALLSYAEVAAAKPKIEKIDTLKTYELQSVQVVSTRANSKTPVAFSDLTKLKIKQLNYGKDVPDIISFLPSVTTSSDAGNGVGYTGIHVRGTDPTRINVTANGIPVNDAESSELYWVDLGDFISSVETVQLQRGVGTSTNGSGAFGATLNMQTDNISMKPYFGLDVSGGTYGTHKETARFSTGLLHDHWGFQGRLSNIGSDGYIDRAFTHLNSYFLQGGYFGDNTVVKLITYNSEEQTYHAWDYASKTDMEKYGRTYNPCGAYTDDEGNTAYYKNQTDNYHQQNYQLLWNQRMGNFLNYNFALHYTHGDGYYEQYETDQKLYKYLLTSTLGSKSDLVRQKKMDNDFYGFVTSLNFDNKNGLTANIGGGFSRYDGDHFGKVIWVRQFSGNINPLHKYYDNNTKKNDGNIYGKVTYEFLKGLNGYLDLQYRHVSLDMSGSSQAFDENKKQKPLTVNKKYDFFNPKVGLIYNFLQNHTVYLSYAIAHKEPTRSNFEDMLKESEQVDPQKETLRDLEAGYKYESQMLSAGANFYYMDYDNQFVLTGAQDSNGQMVARNIKDSYRMGLELTAALRPFDGFTWEANATWSKNRAQNVELTVLDPNTWEQSKVNVGDTHLAFSPDFILNNRFTYELKGFRAALTSKYVGEQYMTNSDFRSYTDADGKAVSAMIDKMFVSDLDLSYTFKWRGIKSCTVGVTVYNLFDEKYESNGSCGLNFKQENGKVVAFGNDDFWSWSTYSAQAPTHFLAHLSLNF